MADLRTYWRRGETPPAPGNSPVSGPGVGSVAADEPSQSWTKDEIKAYLDSEGVEYTNSMTKDELLGLV